MSLLRKFSLFALAAVVLFGLGAQRADANCAWAGIPGETALVFINNTSLDAGHNNLTIGVNGNLSADRHSSDVECYQTTGGPEPFCTWAQSVSPQTSPSNTVSITSGPSGVLGQSITVSVTPGTAGSGCFDSGTETRFSGSETFDVSALSNGTYNFTVQVRDTYGKTDTANGSFTINRAAPTYTLTVTKAGTGTGTVTSSPAGINCGADCSQSYNEGTSVTLTATPGTGSTFAGWSGAADCSDGVAYMGQSKTCTATFNTSVGSAPTCSPASQTVAPGQTASFNASGGTGSYTWSGGGTPATGSGSSFNTSYSTTGGKIVTVTSGGLSGTCSVTVVLGGTCSQISVSSNEPTNWLIGGPQVDGQYIHSPGYPSYVTSGSHGADSSGNPLPQGSYGIMAPALSGFTGPTITPSPNQNCSGSISFNLEYTPDGEPPPPPPGGGGACTGPTALGVGMSGTFSGTDGGSHAWSSSGANPSSGSGPSYTASWATGGTKVVYMDGGGGNNDCTVCVGGPGFCSPPINPTIQLSCVPGSQTVTTGQEANFNSYYGSGAQSGQPVSVSWNAPGGSPSYALGVSSFSTTYGTTGSKTVTISKSGVLTYIGDTCAVTVQPPAVTTGTVIVQAVEQGSGIGVDSGNPVATTWTLSTPAGPINESVDQTSKTYLNQPTTPTSLYSVSNLKSVAGYGTPYVLPSSQNLTGGGTIVFTIFYPPLSGTASVDLVADPQNIFPAGDTTDLTWTSTNTTSCTATAGTGFDTGGAVNGTDTSGALFTTTTFTVTCDAVGGGTVSDSETVSVPPQCSDGINNDEDGLIDADDPGCLSGPGGTYDPNDDSEADDQGGGEEPPLEPTECSDDLDNDGDGLYDFDGAPGLEGQPDFSPDDGCTSLEDNSEKYDPDIREI